jgi:hypothetical protein
MTDEFRQRFAGRYFGKYRGVVADITDPLKLCRILVRVPVVLGADELLGWAYPSPGQGGSLEAGLVWPAQVNDFVWVEFEEGDPQKPIWSAGPWGRRDNESMLPKHARGEQDIIDTLIRDTGIIPASTFAGEFPYVRIMQSAVGHLLELDDTPSNERVQLAHKLGTRFEMLADGSMELVTANEMRQRVEGPFKLETKRWSLQLDDTATLPKIVLRDKQGINGSYDGIEYNGLARTMTIHSTSSLAITSLGTIDIDALNVNIKGRPVQPGSEPI